MNRRDLFYVRFMDDIVILAPTRWALRRAVKVVNEVLAGLCLEKHPDKTFIGQIVRGFDFLGYHLSPAGLALAKTTIANFIDKASRLYEQKRKTVEAVCPLEMYVRRWHRWAAGGLSGHYEPASRPTRSTHGCVAPNLCPPRQTGCPHRRTYHLARGRWGQSCRQGIR